MTALATAITTFSGMKTVPRQAAADRKGATASIAQLISDARSLFRNQLDKLMTHFVNRIQIFTVATSQLASLSIAWLPTLLPKNRQHRRRSRFQCRRHRRHRFKKSELIFSDRVFFPTGAILEDGAKMMAIARFR